LKPVRLGFVPLSDCAVLAAAECRGLFRRHGVVVELSREPSWANIRDKVAVGALDGAQMLAGMPLAAATGIDSVSPPLVTALGLGLNGNAITLSGALWKRLAEVDPGIEGSRAGVAAVLGRLIEDDLHHGRPPLRFGMVYRFAMHNYELREWLAAAAIDPDADARLTVVPPPRMVEALARGAIDGFCVGEPWNSVAVARGAGRIAATTLDIWSNSPEKVFAVTAELAERRPELHQTLLRALLEAAVWCDAAENRPELARLLAEPRYVGAPAALLAEALAGRLRFARDAGVEPVPDLHVFHRHAAGFPWISHAVWILAQMLRWGQIREPIDLLAAARRAYRPDLHREAAAAVGISAPRVDEKKEGAHAAPWMLEGTLGPIQMGRDQLLDCRPFDPRDVVSYLAGCAVRSPRLDLDALAAANP
jgi:nitrate/nitrite transport system substrate-binding protein